VNGTCQLVKDLKIIKHWVDFIVEHTEKRHYNEGVELKCQPMWLSINHYDDQLIWYEGREVLWNQKSGHHTDSQDH
jgi:hypothetical protein